MATDIAIVPGNGGMDVYSENMWYSWLKKKLNAYNPDLIVALENMPDPIVGRESLWIPFMRDQLKIGEKSIIVGKMESSLVYINLTELAQEREGHSTGAIAAVRYCERYKVRGIVLVGAYTTDLGIENEIRSEYFNRPWDWEKAKNNTDWIVQFGSGDDEFLPWAEQVDVSANLQTEFHQFKDKGHFLSDVLPELMTALKQKLEN